ncbi:MAG: hypothetical protein ACI8P3_003820 [Saprospiraceae bacterium]|jgi:hypothetical protein
MLNGESIFIQNETMETTINGIIVSSTIGSTSIWKTKKHESSQILEMIDY